MADWQKRDSRRQEIIRHAVQAADRIIMTGSLGSCEETNFLTAKVAEAFMQKALRVFSTEVQKMDLVDDHPDSKSNDSFPT